MHYDQLKIIDCIVLQPDT